MLLSVLADTNSDSTVTVNLWLVAIVLVIIAALIYIIRHFR